MPNAVLASVLIAVLLPAVTTPVTSQPATPTAVRAVDPFWQQLGDTVLAQLVDDAVRGGTSVAAATARLDAARASHRLSAFDFAPTVTASGSLLSTRQSTAQIPGLTQPLPQRGIYDVGFDAAWELDLFGRIRNNVGAQSALVASAELSAEDVRVSVSADVGRHYFELRGAQRQLSVAARNAEVQRRTLALTEERLAAGRGTAFDVERARAVLQLTLGAIPELRTRVAAARLRLASLLGRAPEELPAALVADGPLPRLPDSLVIAPTSTLIQRRPDVLAAERQLAAQTSAVRSEKADYLPRVAIAASTGFTASRLDALTNTGASRLLVGPVVSFPFLDLGRVRERVEYARAREDEARTQYRATVLLAQEETGSALVAYNEAHARLALLDEAVKASAKASDLAQQRFEAGLTDLLQVLDAQRTLLEAESQLATAHTDAAVALVALYKALGGAWAVR